MASNPNAPHERSPLNGNSDEQQSFVYRVQDMLSPFSQSALNLLPRRGEGQQTKAKRADRIPDSQDRPLVTDYHSINDPSLLIRVPKKIETPVKVESKIWFANERTYNAYSSMGVFMSLIAVGLLSGSKDETGRIFATVYAAIAIGVLIYGCALFQRRLTLISTRHGGTFDVLIGPLLICGALVIALMVNFSVRVAQAREAIGQNPLDLALAWQSATEKSEIMNNAIAGISSLFKA